MDIVQRKKLEIERLKLRKVNCQIRIAQLELDELDDNTYQRPLYI